MTGALSYFEAHKIYFSLKQESGDKVLVKINTENSWTEKEVLGV